MVKTSDIKHAPVVAAKAADQITTPGEAMRKSRHAGIRILGLPVRGIEMLGAAVIKWAEGPPPSDTDWMHTTHFPSDKIRQECIDAFWAERGQ